MAGVINIHIKNLKVLIIKINKVDLGSVQQSFHFLPYVQNENSVIISGIYCFLSIFTNPCRVARYKFQLISKVIVEI